MQFLLKMEFSVSCKSWGSQSPYKLNYSGKKRGVLPCFGSLGKEWIGSSLHPYKCFWDGRGGEGRGGEGREDTMDGKYSPSIQMF
jgi:hypothetical protein